MWGWEASNFDERASSVCSKGHRCSWEARVRSKPLIVWSVGVRWAVFCCGLFKRAFQKEICDWWPFALFLIKPDYVITVSEFLRFLIGNLNQSDFYNIKTVVLCAVWIKTHKPNRFNFYRANNCFSGGASSEFKTKLLSI